MKSSPAQKYWIVILGLMVLALAGMGISGGVGFFLRDSLGQGMKREIQNTLDVYLSLKRGEVDQYVESYAYWGDFSSQVQRLRKGESLDQGWADSWLAGNANVNSYTAVIRDREFLVEGGVDAELLAPLIRGQDFLASRWYPQLSGLKGPRISEILVLDQEILLASASPLCDDQGNPVSQGIALFVRRLGEKDWEILSKLTRSTVSPSTTAAPSPGVIRGEIRSTEDSAGVVNVDFLPQFRADELAFISLLIPTTFQFIIILLIFSAFLALNRSLQRVTSEVLEKSAFLEKQAGQFMDLSHLSDNLSQFSLDFQNNMELTSRVSDGMKNRLSGQIMDAVAVFSKMDDLAVMIVDTSHKIHNISSHIESSIGTIRESAQLTQGLTASLSKVRKVTTESMDIAQDLNQSSLEGQEMVVKLNKATQETAQASEGILQTLAVISDISEKTNLLAINAAIESARAGLHGKGFAVVAGEIRKLSESTKNNAMQIEFKLKSVVEKANETQDLAQATGSQFNTISDLTDRNYDIASEVTEALEQQGVLSEQLVMANNLVVGIAEELKDAVNFQAQIMDKIQEAMRNLQNHNESSKEQNLDLIQSLQTMVQKMAELQNSYEQGKNFIGAYSQLVKK